MARVDGEKKKLSKFAVGLAVGLAAQSGRLPAGDPSLFLKKLTTKQDPLPLETLNLFFPQLSPKKSPKYLIVLSLAASYVTV